MQKNDAEAVKWYLKAADQGETSVYSPLGWAYYQGTGVPADGNEAVKWFKRAAEGNDAASAVHGRLPV